jgi:hypothetical protein
LAFVKQTEPAIGSGEHLNPTIAKNMPIALSGQATRRSINEFRERQGPFINQRCRVKIAPRAVGF